MEIGWFLLDGWLALPKNWPTAEVQVYGVIGARGSNKVTEEVEAMSLRALQSGRRKLRLEALERRCMLSGNVLLSVNVAGDLVLTGDNTGNGILIQETATDIVVTGLTTTAPTTIQGLPSLAFPKGGVTHDFRINMRGGDDVVEIGVGSAAQVEVKHDLLVDMGLSGNEVLVMEGVKVDHSATLASSTGQDIFVIRQLPGAFASTIVGDLRLLTGNGNKMIMIGNTTVGGSALIATGYSDHLIGLAGNPIGGSLNVFTGNGNNTILSTLDTATTDGAVDNFATAHPYFAGTNPPFFANAASLKADLNAAAVAAAGAGGNSIKVTLDVKFQTGWLGGDDFIDIGTASVGGDLKVNAGNGLNVIGISKTSVGADALIKTGMSDDLVTLLALSVVNKLKVDTSWGNDVVGASTALRQTAFTDYGTLHPSGNLTLLATEFGPNLAVPNITANSIEVRLGWGNDKLIFDNNTFVTALLDGGFGSDTLDKSANTNVGSLTFINFETVL